MNLTQPTKNPITIDEIMDSEIRALSWKQPYADLMLHGKIETRTWRTKYRGLVLICASKKPYDPHDTLAISGPVLASNIVRSILLDRLNNPERGMHGYAIAVGRLVDCRPMEPADEEMTYVQYKEPWTTTVIGKHKQVRMIQRQLYCHVYEDVVPIRPFTFKGSQGWKKLNGQFIKSFIEMI